MFIFRHPLSEQISFDRFVTQVQIFTTPNRLIQTVAITNIITKTFRRQSLESHRRRRRTSAFRNQYWTRCPGWWRRRRWCRSFCFWVWPWNRTGNRNNSETGTIMPTMGTIAIIRHIPWRQGRKGLSMYLDTRSWPEVCSEVLIPIGNSHFRSVHGRFETDLSNSIQILMMLKFGTEMPNLTLNLMLMLSGIALPNSFLKFSWNLCS